MAVWAAGNPGRLTQVERALMARTHLVLSVVSLWELKLKWSPLDPTGLPKGPMDPLILCKSARMVAWDILPLTADHVTASSREPIMHRDPFHELLLIQAQQEGMRLLTRDAALVRHPISATAT